MARPDDPDVRLLRALRSAGGANVFLGPGDSGIAWKERVAGLRAAGYGIKGDPEAGWRLTSTPATLIADDVLATLPASPPPIIGREIVVFEETDSTNDVAARAGQAGAAEGLVIFAEKQRAGRGRLGRAWESRPRVGLWCSVLLRPPDVPRERWSELTFCAALAVAQTAEQHTRRPARIKWPNDVLVSDRKVAGILLETHHSHTPGFVVMGIGLNVLQTEEDFDPALRQRAGSLAMAAADNHDAPLGRRAVAATLLQALNTLYSRWPQGFASIMQACEQRGCHPSGVD